MDSKLPALNIKDVKTVMVGGSSPRIAAGGNQNILEIQATIDPKAAKARPEDFVDFGFLDELKKSDYLDKLYGRS